MHTGQGTPLRSRCRARGLPLATLLLAALALAWAPHPAHAREGLYAGVGGGNPSFSDDIQGTEVVPNADGTNEVRVGKPESGTGFVFNGGFGFNDYLAVDLLLSYSKHRTVFGPGTPTPQRFDASLRTVIFGAKVGAPLGDVGEVFGRAGISGYELVYESNNFNVPGGTVADDSRLSGSGFAAGAGGELFFGPWGLQLAYTYHDAEFSSVDSLNFTGEVNPGLDTTIQSVSLTLNFYLQ